jgi:large subunit ribosomal protein L25
MTDEIKLVGEKRECSTGAGLTQLRVEGRIPAVLYGPSIDSTPISVDEKEFKAAISTEHGENALIKLKIGSKKAVTTLVKEIQVHPVTYKIIHVDLCQIDLTHEIEVEVPLEVEGDAVGVKTEGGVLEHIIRNLKVKCMPTEIPDKFVVDVAELNIGDGIKVKDIPVVKGVEILDDPEAVAVNVVAPTELKEPEEGVELEEETAMPEVIQNLKSPKKVLSLRKKQLCLK